jgi:hypothetical protein
LINYFTASSLNVKHRLSFSGLLSYDPKYFQSSLTALDTDFLERFITDHRFNIHDKILADSFELLKQGLIHQNEQIQVNGLTKNLFYFKIHLGSDYFHPILRDIRRMNSKSYFFRRINQGVCRKSFNKNDYKECEKF